MAESTIRTETFLTEGVSVFADFVVADRNDEVILAGFFDRAKAKVKAMACSMGRKNVAYGYMKLKTKEAEYRSVYKPVRLGRDHFVYGVSINKRVGDTLIVTTKEFAKADFFQFLMRAGKLPLLEEWTDYIYDMCLKNHLCNDVGYLPHIRSVNGRTLPIHGKHVNIRELVLLDVSGIDNDELRTIVSTGLKKGSIKLGKGKMKPLEFEDFNSYIQNYGPSMVSHLEEQIETLSPLKGIVDEVAFKKKRLFPQQAACINGIVALKKAGSRYGLMIEGMGCGKTLQGAGVVDAYFNKVWLDAHPGKTLRALYESQEDPVRYRNIMMAPPHLVEKWKDEILSEIPGTRVEVLDDFSKLINLRAGGKMRRGREWYLISKDTCKLGSQMSPIPTTVGKVYPKISFCKDCMEAGRLVHKIGVGNQSRCPFCNGRRFVKRADVSYGKLRGLLCPDCGELLLKYSPKLGRSDCDLSTYVLGPSDFASHNTSNSVCYHCGAQLWGVDSKPVDMGGEYSSHVKKRKPAWYKITHWKNHAKKGKKTAFVLRGHEEEYLMENEIEEYEISPREYGPRKTAPALFIKKYLKGYFDFCVLDEAHKYENGGTAQSNAAHALMSASDFTLCLTGTICNGKADSFFYLLYMLDPKRMKQMGYNWGDVTAFGRKYGTVETIYEQTGDGAGVYNAASRGRVIQSPRIKPGISPLLLADFLMDKSVFLDLSDLSKHLPTLTEEVVLVDMDPEVRSAYEQTIDVLKNALRSPEGAGMLTNILQFGLSYPDKPWGRKEIKAPFIKDCVVARPINFPVYEEDKLLLPKERKLIEIINQELSEGRNCFVYCSYTGDGETNVTHRLKELIEMHCNLRGRVQILQAASPEPTKRDRWIKEKAAEGIKVFICNPKCVETGLDFCFWWEGSFYNYPTIIFYQINYELAVIWQASRRGYRLNQTVDCKTMYLAYEGTLQAAALEIMAEKQVAASAIQGKFSAEGLTAMAHGVDPRLKLAQMLAAGDTSDRNTLAGMFDVMNASNQSSDEDRYGDVSRAMTYYELMGITEETEPASELSLFDVAIPVGASDNNTTEGIANMPPEDGDNVFFSMMEMLGTIETVILREEEISPVKPKKAKKDPKAADGQMSFFDFLSA